MITTPGTAAAPTLHRMTQGLVSPWYVEAWLRFRSLFWLKTIGITGFMTLFFTAYLYLLKNPSGETTVMPLTVVDDWIGFNPWSLSIYLSLWVYTSLAPGLLAHRRDLERYGIAIGAVCLFGLACFYFFPTAVPVSDLVWEGAFGFDFLKKVDSTGNACPSLHVASAVFSGMWIHRELREMGATRRVLACNVLWCIAIIYSTMATKQHVALDVLGGLVLGVLGAWLSFRWITLTQPRRPLAMA